MVESPLIIGLWISGLLYIWLFFQLWNYKELIKKAIKTDSLHYLLEVIPYVIYSFINGHGIAALKSCIASPGLAITLNVFSQNNTTSIIEVANDMNKC